MEKTNRVKIVTGLKCNIQCLFCYYRDSLKAPNRSLAEVERDLRYARRNGITSVDFSGGEPTVHPQLPAMISKAKLLGMKTVSIISNGYRLADREYMRSLKESGLDEILFSVHGPDPTLHDQLTNVQGSFEHIALALHNAGELGISVRTNTVVTRINLESLAKIAKFVLDFKPIQVNFITINDWCYAKHLVDKLMATYSEMYPKLEEACDLLDDRVKAVNVRYIPFCFMKGYERFICNHRQVPYDPFEWRPRVRARLEIQNPLWRYAGIIGYGLIAGKAYKNAFKMPFKDMLDECVTEGLRRRFYTKSRECKACMYNELCDGLENTYVEKFGTQELSPSHGEIIPDPLYFRRLVTT